ncbi:MAG: helix-turn-helix domain-containing protein, partial [Parasphingorhabdus sp.]
ASRVTGYLPSELKGSDRTRGITRVRQAMAHVMKDGLKRSYPEIANNFGRHHSTIMHGVALSRRLETTDTNHRTLLQTLRAVL